MRTELRVLLIRDPPTTHGANWMTRCYQATKKIRIGFFWNRTAFFVGLLLQKSFIECTKVCAVSVLGHSTHKMDQDEFYHNPGAFASKTSSCLQTWQPILQLFDYFSSSATTPKKQIHCHLLYFGCYQPAKKKKARWRCSPWISGQQNRTSGCWLVQQQDSNIVNMSVFRANTMLSKLPKTFWSNNLPNV